MWRNMVKVVTRVHVRIVMHTPPQETNDHFQKERRTALMLAARNGAFSIVKLLMKHKPDVNMYIKDSVSARIVYLPLSTASYKTS